MKKWLIAAMIALNMNTCAAENLKFIDAKDYSGYFIDTDTIKLESGGAFEVKMLIIRANENEMDEVSLKINTSEQKYKITGTRTLSYDERTEIRRDEMQRAAKSYSDKSLMGEIVEVVMNGDFKD